MKHARILLVASACVVAGGLSAAAAALSRPLAAQGPDATTLLVFAHTRTSYALGDARELLKLQLQRVATRVKELPLEEVSAEKLQNIQYLVVFCPQPVRAFPTNFLQAVGGARLPILWVGYGFDKLPPTAPFPTRCEALAADHAVTNVVYRDRCWEAPLFPWLSVTLLESNQVETLIKVQDGPSTRPLCWRIGSWTVFAGVPMTPAITYLFSDLLLDYYGVNDTSAPALFVRIEDYSPAGNHREFRRMADYLASRGVPFMVGVSPAWRDRSSGKMEDLNSQPEFVASLIYAQQRGGRIVMHGYTHTYDAEAGEGHEFWDLEKDRPLAEESADFIRQRVLKGARALLQHGLFPLAWETPHYAASRLGYQEFGRIFSTAVERVQLSDTTQADKGFVSGLTLDAHGRSLVPENLGYVPGDVSSNRCEQIRATAQFLCSMRGTVAGCYIHAYQPLSRLQELIETLEPLGRPWVDLAELDNVVEWPGTVLLSGRAKRGVVLHRAEVRWKAFSRSGQIVAQEVEPAKVNGRREFSRRGVGNYEVYEFAEERP